MPVIEWGSCTNCGRSCAGPPGSFCSNVCETVYNAKKQATHGKVKPATPTDQPTHQVPKKPSSGGCQKKFLLLAGTTGGLGAAVGFALVKLTKAALR